MQSSMPRLNWSTTKDENTICHPEEPSDEGSGEGSPPQILRLRLRMTFS